MPVSGSPLASGCSPNSRPSTSSVTIQPAWCELNASSSLDHRSRAISRVAIGPPSGPTRARCARIGNRPTRGGGSAPKRAYRGRVHRPSTTFLAALLCMSGAASVYADVPAPAVAGPISGPESPSIDSTRLDLASYGYVEEEFFVSGTATSYGSDAPLSADGKWTALPRDRATYTTRLLVRRPATRARFDGTVLVEWLNVSAGFDGTPD